MISGEMKWNDCKTDKAHQSKTCRKATARERERETAKNEIWKANQLIYFSRIMTGMLCCKHMWVTSHRMDYQELLKTVWV